MTPHELMRQGAAHLARTLTGHAAEPLVYKRGHHAVPLCGTMGLSTAHARGITTRVEHDDRDFIVRADALGLTPEAGDTIEYKGDSFEIMVDDAGSPAWSPCDPFGTLVRIHTRRVAAT